MVKVIAFIRSIKSRERPPARTRFWVQGTGRNFTGRTSCLQSATVNVRPRDNDQGIDSGTLLRAGVSAARLRRL